MTTNLKGFLSLTSASRGQEESHRKQPDCISDNKTDWLLVALKPLTTLLNS